VTEMSIAIFQAAELEALIEPLSSDFNISVIPAFEQYQDIVEAEHPRLILFPASFGFELMKEMVDDLDDIVLILVSMELSLDDKLKAFDIGVGDVIDSVGSAIEEIKARLSHAVFNQIANEQLQSRMNMANEMAMTAMSNTSDLGGNIQFLLQSVNCNNLDELGQLLFQALNSYGLNCSLQMRSIYSVKNMEANGMSKDLESHLLTEMKDVGRYYDFGKRTICNYNRVSLLIKNMPVDDEVRFGAIKDNTFSLLQGLDARIEALDNIVALSDEKRLLQALTRRMQSVMGEVEEQYRTVAINITSSVETMAISMEECFMHLGLMEEQELQLNQFVENCIKNANEVFKNTDTVDESFTNILITLEDVFNGQHLGLNQDQIQKLVDNLNNADPSFC